MSQLYQEGDFFSIPLGHSTCGVGLVARKPRRGSVILGYFFGHRLPQSDVPADLHLLQPADARLICRLKDSGLHRGFWRVIGAVPEWSREQWPVPSFLRMEGLSGRGIRIDYDGENLVVPARETEADVTDGTLAEDVVLEEARVTELLDRLTHSHPAAGTDPAQWTG